jgi:RHS repeat-associated protein
MKSSSTGAVTTSYLYNALGQRVRKSGGGAGTVLYAYDEAGHLLGEYDSAGNLIQETVWLGDIPVATLRPGSPVAIDYVHTDHLNTPRKVTRPSDDAVLWRWDSDPFGATAPNENPQGLGTFSYNLRYPGQYFDVESGLSYNYFRDYDPAIGRYVESDPVGLAGGINTYAYVDGDPIDFLDRFGLARCTYSISTHTLVCDSNDYSRAERAGPEGVFSGFEECRNNPECVDDKNRGPVQPGDYDLVPSRKHHGSYWLKEGFVKRQLCKLGVGRCEFFFHLGTYSLGCITVERENLHARQQFDRIRSILRGDSHNTVTVVP